MVLLHQPDEFFLHLQRRLQQPLPGADAQNRMTMRSRKTVEEYLAENPGHRRSAVLMPLFPHKGEIHTLLIKRPSYQGVHSGQLALPGGAEEAEDASPAQTALREAREEVGLHAGEEQLLGALSPLYIPPSNFLVRPFVAQLPQRPQWLPSPDEVEALLEIPLRTFLDPAVKDTRKINIGSGITIEAPCYIIEGNILWGATAMMFSEMEALLEEMA
ncbi:MAG: CoA pyrophosphatase [Bacteroidetes bacterium]|nr:CoA pyrophosphatase [Bacteroidota bacterium]